MKCARCETKELKVVYSDPSLTNATGESAMICKRCHTLRTYEEARLWHAKKAYTPNDDEGMES